MTGPEHWKEAELIVLGERCDYGCPHAGCAHEMAYLARAQVHATLAAAAATALGREGDGALMPDDRAAWIRVASEVPGESRRRREARETREQVSS